jgi:hypothetical protein
MFTDHRQRALDQQCRVLQARSGVLRDALARDSQALRAPLALADQGLAGLRWLQAHPEWVGVGVAVLVVWRPRRVWRLGTRLWAGWRLWRRVQRWRLAVAAMAPGR